jgi:hypothetical protein
MILQEMLFTRKLATKKNGKLTYTKICFCMYFNLFNLVFFLKRLELSDIVTEMNNQNS